MQAHVLNKKNNHNNKPQWPLWPLNRLKYTSKYYLSCSLYNSYIDYFLSELQSRCLCIFTKQIARLCFTNQQPSETKNKPYTSIHLVFAFSSKFAYVKYWTTEKNTKTLPILVCALNIRLHSLRAQRLTIFRQMSVLFLAIIKPDLANSPLKRFSCFCGLPGADFVTHLTPI